MSAGARIIRPVSGAETILFDVCLRESHEGEVTVTEHPVEIGAAVADHARAALNHISLEVMVSNYPIESPPSNADGVSGAVSPHELVYQEPLHLPVSLPGAATLLTALGANIRTVKDSVNVLQFSAPFNRVQSVYTELWTIKTDAELVTISTPLWYYENMVITHLSAPREPETGGSAIIFTIEARELRFVETQTVAAVPNSKADKGAQPTKPADTGNPADSYRSSLASNIKDMVANAIGGL